MTLRQLEYLLAVADHGSFTAAARELHVAQPSLSEQIRRLEAELGGPLLERASRGVRPTAAGTMLIAKARTALAAVADGRRIAMRELASPGGVCLASSPAAPDALIAAAIAAIGADDDPRLTVRWHRHESDERVLEKIRDGAGTVAVCEAPPSWDGPLVALTRQRLVLAVPSGVDPATLPLALTGYEARVAAPADLAAAGTIETPGVAEALLLAAAGGACAVVPGDAIAAAPELDVRPLTAPAVHIVALTVTDPIPAAAALMTALAQAASAAPTARLHAVG